MAHGRKGAGHHRAFWRVADGDPALRLFSRGRTRATAPETGGVFLVSRLGVTSLAGVCLIALLATYSRRACRGGGYCLSAMENANMSAGVLLQATSLLIIVAYPDTFTLY